MNKIKQVTQIGLTSMEYSFRLFSADHSDTCSSSWTTLWELDDGMIKNVSSAYLFRAFSAYKAWMSDVLRTYAIGPINNPCMKLAFISRILDIALLYFVQWWHESRYSTSQLWILFGIGNCVILFINDECHTESNALEKSSTIKCMNSCFSRSTDILWSRLIKAAVVDPVGRKANWSRKRCRPVEMWRWQGWDVGRGIGRLGMNVWRMIWKCLVYILNGRRYSGMCGGTSYGQTSNPS